MKQPHLSFDHLVVAATELSAGAAHVAATLGVDVPAGGAHPRMGTHNRLMRLGKDEFLEVIAVDPDAPAPDIARWYGLDGWGQAAPRLLTWVLRTDDLDATLAALPPVFGRPLQVSRGNLTWRIAVPEDGALPFDGAGPTLIEWPMRPFPGAAMSGFDCTMTGLVLRHPDADTLAQMLAPFLDDPRVRFEAAQAVALEAEIATPDGSRRLA